MGWTHLNRNKQESVATFFKKGFSDERQEVLDVVTTLNVSYIALRVKGIVEDQVIALVVLIRHFDENKPDACGYTYNFGYKAMDEMMGPNESQCPERILKLLTPTTDEHALAWRARCYAALDKKKHAAKAGDIIRFTEPLTFTDHAVLDTFKVMQHAKGLETVRSRVFYGMEHWGMSARERELLQAFLTETAPVFSLVREDTVGCYAHDADGTPWCTWMIASALYGEDIPDEYKAQCAACGMKIASGWARGKLFEQTFYCASHIVYITSEE